jgi:hypothetical protein
VEEIEMSERDSEETPGSVERDEQEGGGPRQAPTDTERAWSEPNAGRPQVPGSDVDSNGSTDSADSTDMESPAGKPDRGRDRTEPNAGVE